MEYTKQTYLEAIYRVCDILSELLVHPFRIRNSKCSPFSSVSVNMYSGDGIQLGVAALVCSFLVCRKGMGVLNTNWPFFDDCFNMHIYNIYALLPKDIHKLLIITHALQE